LLGQFDANPFATSRALRQLRDCDTPKFVECALRAIVDQPESASIRFLATLVPLTDPILELIAHPKAFDEAGARRIVEVMRRIDSQTESKLLRLITANPAKPLAPQIIDRILDVIDSITDTPRLVPVLMQIYRAASPYLRARLALSIGRHHRNKDWIEDRMRDNDARVRANAVEANWTYKDDQALNLFQASLRDNHHRVVANGAVGLYFAGDIRSLRMLADLAARSEPNFRAAGLWAIGHVQDTRFLSLLERSMTDERDVTVRRSMVVAMARIKCAADLASELPRLGVRLIKATRQNIPPCAGESAVRCQNHLFVEVTSADGAAVRNLKTLQFQVAEDNRAVLDYSVQARTRYIKPGAYDIYYTSSNSSEDPQNPPPLVRVTVVTECATGVYDSGETPAVPAPPKEPEEKPRIWDAFSAS
jgi:hypothetical protein